jgi:hypothetical protein
MARNCARSAIHYIPEHLIQAEMDYSMDKQRSWSTQALVIFEKKRFIGRGVLNLLCEVDSLESPPFM